MFNWGSERSQEKFALGKLMRVRWVQNFIWHLVHAYGRTKWASTWPTWLSSSTLSQMKDSASALLTRKTIRCECEQWNTLCTTKLKEVVASARTTFKRQSTKEGELLKDNPFKEWLASRPVARRPIGRPIYWEISSDAYTRFKMGSLQNGVWAWVRERKFWSAPLRGTVRWLVCQRWKGSAVVTILLRSRGSQLENSPPRVVNLMNDS